MCLKRHLKLHKPIRKPKVGRQGFLCFVTENAYHFAMTIEHTKPCTKEEPMEVYPPEAAHCSYLWCSHSKITESYKRKHRYEGLCMCVH